MLLIESGLNEVHDKIAQSLVTHICKQPITGSSIAIM